MALFANYALKLCLMLQIMPNLFSNYAFEGQLTSCVVVIFMASKLALFPFLVSSEVLHLGIAKEPNISASNPLGVPCSTKVSIAFKNRFSNQM